MRKQDWELDQIENSKLGDKEKQSVKKLLSALWSLNLDDSERKNVSSAFDSLVNGRAIVVDEPETQYRWESARPGALVVRDWVRVKSDAYKGEAGLIHNGRQGVIVAMRYGDIHVRYDDERGTSHPIKHSPHALEKRFTLRSR